MAFSKKIVVWSMATTSFFIAISLAGWYLCKIPPSVELSELITVIITGVILSYAGKSGMENYQKIRKE